MSKVSWKEWKSARAKYNHFCMLLPHDEWQHFDEYVGVSFPTGWHSVSQVFTLTEDEARRVKAMLGPNAYAIFQAYRARKKNG